MRFAFSCECNISGLLTKCEVKMAQSIKDYYMAFEEIFLVKHAG